MWRRHRRCSKPPGTHFTCFTSTKSARTDAKGAASCVAARGEALGGYACTDVLTHRYTNTPIYCYRCVAARGEALEAMRARGEEVMRWARLIEQVLKPQKNS